MRVAIDIRPLAGQMTGIGRFTENMVQGLSLADRENEYTLYGFFCKRMGSAVARARAFERENFSVRTRRIPGTLMRLLWKSSLFSIETLLGNVDVVLMPDYLVPRRRSAKLLVVVYDVIPFLHPEWYPPASASRICRDLCTVFREADLVVAISESTRNDILKVAGLGEDRVTVVSTIASPVFCRSGNREAWDKLKVRYGIRDRFILFVGTFEPRKNIPGLCQAYMRLRTTVKIAHQLVLVGGTGWMCEAAFAAIRKLDGSDVVVTGYVTDEELSHLYREADVFVYPSFYEGFGLPVLEAMACGTPVVTANTSSFPEVVGEAGIMVDPCEPQQLADAIGSVVCDRDLSRSLVERGMRRADLFTAQRMGAQMRKSLERIGRPH